MKHIDAQWKRREPKRTELDSFEVSTLAQHAPDRCAVVLTMRANRELGNRHYRWTEELPLDIAVDPRSVGNTFDELEDKLADAVKEYEAANPVVAT